MKVNNGIKKIFTRLQSGTSYVELIVVLSIFGTITSMSLFNYKEFQIKVDMNNLANDIALKFVEAQKSSVNGKWNSSAPITIPPWKPSYGLYFNMDTATSSSFTYFADLNQNQKYNIGEVLEVYNITKGNLIDEVKVFYVGGSTLLINNASTPISISFKRTNSFASFFLNSGSSQLPNADFTQVRIRSPKGTNSCVQMYTSGRIQIGSCL